PRPTSTPPRAESQPRCPRRAKPATGTDAASLGPPYPTRPHNRQMPSRLSSGNGSPVIAKPSRASCASRPSPASSMMSGSDRIGWPHRSQIATRLGRTRRWGLLCSLRCVLQNLQRILDGLGVTLLHFKFEARATRVSHALPVIDQHDKGLGVVPDGRSEERRVGKECRSGGGRRERKGNSEVRLW